MKLVKYFLLTILAALLVARLCLPYVLIHYVENQINKLPDYKVKIADLDVSLYRGSYFIKNMQLWKISKNIPVPFFKANVIDLSVQWGALLHGNFVGKIIVQHPVINFVDDPQGKNEQLTIDQQWLKIVKSLFPLNINQVAAHDGQIHLRSFSGKPPFDIYLKNAEFQLKNMQKTTQENKQLSSSYEFSANTMDGGQVSAGGQFDPFAQSPTFKLKAELKSMDVIALRAFLQHYTSIGVERGTFSLYVETAAADGEITGYAKPFIKNLKIGTRTNNPIEALYNGAVAVLAKVLENSDKKTIATRVNLHGNIQDPDVSTLSIIGYLLRHAFIQALVPQIDNTVKMQDVYYGKQA